MGVCNCSMFCCMLLYVHSSIAINLMGKRELVALLNLSSWCLVMVEWFFLAVPPGCLQIVTVVFPDHTYLLFFAKTFSKFYRRYYDLISKFQVEIKSLLCQGLSEPEFYGDLVYKLKKIGGSNSFQCSSLK